VLPTIYLIQGTQNSRNLVYASSGEHLSAYRCIIKLIYNVTYYFGLSTGQIDHKRMKTFGPKRNVI